MSMYNTLLILTVFAAAVGGGAKAVTKKSSSDYQCFIEGTTMTPAKRRLAVTLMNAYRTVESAGVLGYPPSQNMYQLNYSCTAEKYAMVLCDQEEELKPIKNPSPIPIAAAFQTWFANNNFGAFINSTGVYDPNFDYTLFSQMISGYAISIGCTDTCKGKDMVFCTFEVCTALTFFGQIYEVGSGPCMADSDCTTFPESTCNMNNGLCIHKPNTPVCPPGAKLPSL